MKEITVLKENKPTVVDYKVYDNYLEAHADIGKDNNYTFKYDPLETWRKIIVNEVNYYQHYSGGYYSNNILLTVEAYEQLMGESKRFYSIHEHELIRTQKNSNCRYTGDLESPDKVIAYMLNGEHSWLPQIHKECDVEIAELQKKIDKLNEVKIILQNEDYLRKNIKMEIVVKSNQKEVE